VCDGGERSCLVGGRHWQAREAGMASDLMGDRGGGYVLSAALRSASTLTRYTHTIPSSSLHSTKNRPAQQSYRRRHPTFPPPSSAPSPSHISCPHAPATPFPTWTSGSCPLPRPTTNPDNPWPSSPRTSSRASGAWWWWASLDRYVRMGID